MKKWIILLLVIILSVGSVQAAFACTPPKYTYGWPCPTITPKPPQGPIANNDTYCTYQDKTLDVPSWWGFLSNDWYIPWGGNYSVKITNNVDHGTLTWKKDGSFKYKPNFRFKGQDKFEYTVTVGGKSSKATVYINVYGRYCR